MDVILFILLLQHMMGFASATFSEFVIDYRVYATIPEVLHMNIMMSTSWCIIPAF